MIDIPRKPPEDVLLAAAMETAQDLAQADLLGKGTALEIENAAREIARNTSGYDDGYELAKKLDEREGWEINADVVEHLDSHWRTLEKHRDAWLTKWLAENNVQPPLPVGARVKYHQRFSETITGTITAIYEHRPASYMIKRDDYEGDQYDDDGSIKRFSRAIVWWDKVEALEEEAA